jgi:hypothetical protein
MISQMARNESVRFGRYIDIEISYKILWLKIPKLVLILHYLACFQKGLFGGNFEKNTLDSLGVNLHNQYFFFTITSTENIQTRWLKKPLEP